jgi:hypothetical protein
MDYTKIEVALLAFEGAGRLSALSHIPAFGIRIRRAMGKRMGLES